MDKELKKIKKLDAYLTKKLIKEDDENVRKVYADLLNLLDLEYYKPKGYIIFRGWRPGFTAEPKMNFKKEEEL